MISRAPFDSDLTYNPDTGVFFRNGKIAGSVRKDGYVRIRVGEGKRYFAHVLAWFFVHGEWPKEDLDHINRNPSDNRVANLRECSRSQNMHNTVAPPHNTSGYKGVGYDKLNKKWMAYIQVDRKFKNLGRFLKKEDAALAYNKAAVELFGQFARINQVHLAS